MKSFLITLFVASAAWGSSVSVSCSVTSPIATPIVAPSSASCSQSGPTGTTSRASVQTVFALSNTGGYNTLTINATSMARYVPDQNPAVYPGGGGLGTTTANVDYAETLTTAGPIRAGYLQVFVTGRTSVDGEGKSALLASIPSGSALYPPVFQAAGNSLVSFPTSIYYDATGNPKLVPTTLGTPFLLSATLLSSNEASAQDELSSASASLSYGFRFFEVTGAPVAVSTTPEPSSFGLMALPLLAFAVRKRQNLLSLVSFRKL